ncbi:hypothetical protein BKA62DRAFT_720463 [Auriculariales sp. MPI-PUGE-AT-0066]|nr:hypothetical protein BKA62DRAFT_720463 [Auriculariales sp. MPI-PUGE-AT-0066]
MSDTQHPPLRIINTASKPISAAKASAALETFMNEHQNRVQGETAVGAQLRKLQAALETENAKN